MFGPWIEVFTWFKGLLPTTTKWRRPHINFIFLHYLYLIVITLLGSAFLSITHNIAYIDALFLSSGAATQSGLNTVNLNDIFLYQQIILYLMSLVTNPIFINSMVVFARLFWFEKRFQKVILEARGRRRLSIRSRTGSNAIEDDEDNDGYGDLEHHRIGNREILVLRPGDETIERAEHLMSAEPGKEKEKRSSSSESSQDYDKTEPAPPDSSTHGVPFHRDITFADEIQPPSQRQPVQRSADQHIAILESQRNLEDDGALYIPGPREFEKGHGPQRLQTENLQDGRPKTSEEAPDTLKPTRSRRNSDSGKIWREASSTKSTLETKLGLDKAGHAISTATSGVIKRLGFTLPEKEEKEDQEVKANTHQGLRKRGRTNTFSSFLTTSEADRHEMPYLSYQPTVVRNSLFVNLTEAQKEELGGIEYRSLKTLAIVLCVFYVGSHIFGIVSLVGWIKTSTTWGPVVDRDGANRTWWGIFTTGSMFNDVGYTLTPDSMESFQFAVWPLVLGSYLIVIGNTGFPCMLRFFIWSLSKVVPKSSTVWEELRFLLDHPRRCFTLLFPSRATWWLFWVLVILNGVDLIFFVILDLNDPTVTSLPPGIRVLDGFFQAVSTRTAGFSVVNIANLHPAIQVSYMIMMYISVLPIAISVRRTNVYEEQSLGLYNSPDEDAEGNENQSYVGSHLRRQLSFDLWYLFLGFFIIAIAEGSRIQNDPNGGFTLFAILFEIVSAYGTVGLSLGYPGIDESFSAEFHAISKLVIVAMQIRGRHRGLPYALDKAILLPSESVQTQHFEDDDENTDRRRRLSNASTAHAERPNFGPRSRTTANDSNNATGNYSLNRREYTTGASQASSSPGVPRQRSQSTAGFSRLISGALAAGPINTRTS